MSLLTNTDWYESFLKEEVPNCVNVYNLETGCHLWCELFPAEAVEHARKNFNIDNGIQFTFKQKTCMDIYSFATKRGVNSNHMYGLYFAQRDLLEKFIFYFRKQAEELVNNADKQKILIPDVMRGFKKVEPSFLVNHDVKKVFLNKIGYYSGNKILTNSQAECLKYISRGKTAKETAELLKISRRTVEEHIEKAKIRVGCYSTSQLIDLYLEIYLGEQHENIRSPL